MSEKDTQKPIRKLWVTEAFLLIGFAASLDIITLILNLTVVGAKVAWIPDLVAIFGIGFWALFTSRINYRLILLTLIAFGIEIIPFVDTIPTWTIEVVYIAYLINSGKMRTYSVRQLLTEKGAKEITKEGAGALMQQRKLLPAGSDSSASDAVIKKTGMRYKIGQNVRDQIEKSIQEETVHQEIPKKQKSKESKEVEDIESIGKRKEEFDWTGTYERLRATYPDASDTKIRDLVLREEIRFKRERK